VSTQIARPGGIPPTEPQERDVGKLARRPASRGVENLTRSSHRAAGKAAQAAEARSSTGKRPARMGWALAAWSLLLARRMPTLTLSSRSTARACHVLPLAALLVGAASPRRARADEPSTPSGSNTSPFERRNAVVGVLGFGMPTGLAGVEYERSLIGPIVAAVGAGIGASAGLEASFTARVRHLEPRYAVGLGGGVSYGDAKLTDFNLLGRDSYDLVRGAVWANGELYFEWRRPSGVLFRLEGGAGYPVRIRSCTHVVEAGRGFLGGQLDEERRPCTSGEAHPLVPFMGFAVGRAF
jgi:hypothetical protein